MTPDFTNTRQILALTLFGEIRGGNKLAKEHVASVILNRANHPQWWGKTVLSVCLAHWQFSCWWLQDANHKRMMDVPADDPVYEACDQVAAEALSSTLFDTTHGADSYFATGTAEPNWAARAVHLLDDGWHSFYRVQEADVSHAADPGAPTLSTHTADVSTRSEDLNQLELDRIAAQKLLQP